MALLWEFREKWNCGFSLQDIEKMNTEYDAPFHVDDFGSKNFENRAKKFWAILDGKSTFITVCECPDCSGYVTCIDSLKGLLERKCNRIKAWNKFIDSISAFTLLFIILQKIRIRNFTIFFCFRRRSSKGSKYETDEDAAFENRERGKGCWYYFSKCIGGMWSTRDIETNANKEVFVRTTIRELVIYAIFLVVLTLRKFYHILANYQFLFKNSIFIFSNFIDDFDYEILLHQNPF